MGSSGTRAAWGSVAAGAASDRDDAAGDLRHPVQWHVRPPACRVRDPHRGRARSGRAGSVATSPASDIRLARGREARKGLRRRAACSGSSGSASLLRRWLRSACTDCSSTSAHGNNWRAPRAGPSHELITSTIPRRCSTSAPASARPDCARTSISPSSRSGRRFVPKYLRALEDERFDLLPAPTYVKGFLRSYAEALGLDGQPFVDEYNSRFTVGEDDAPLRARRVPPPTRARGPRESRIAAVALVAIAIATALVIAAWKFGGPEGENVHGLQSGSPTTASTCVRRALRGSPFARATGTRGWR